MLSRLQRLKRLREVDLHPDEAWALMDRVKTQTSRAEDHARLARLIRVTTSVMDQLRTAPLAPKPSAPQRPSPDRPVKRTRQLATAARRRHRR